MRMKRRIQIFLDKIQKSLKKLIILFAYTLVNIF